MTATTHIESTTSIPPNFTGDPVSTATGQTTLPGSTGVTGIDKTYAWFESLVPNDRVDIWSNLLLLISNRSETENFHYMEANRFPTMPVEQRYLSGMLEKLEPFFLNRVREESLASALNELAELDDYAKEAELTPPSPVAKEFAQNILVRLASQAPRDYSVSLWEDGDVVIYSGNTEWRVSVYCRANGGAAFYVDSPDNQDHESQYQSAQDMPVGPIIDALKKIPA